MYRLKNQEVWASDIAHYLNKELVGDDFLLKGPYAIRTPLADRGEAVTTESGTLLITDSPAPPNTHGAHILSQSPDLDLARILLDFFSTLASEGIAPTARVSEGAHLGKGLTIGENSVIEPDVVVGDNTRIMNNAVIHGPAVIGKMCLIKDGAVIGSEAYRFVQDEEGRLIHPPQLGRICIGDRVWLGANSTVERAMLDSTVIEDDVKIDDLVHVGAGSFIGCHSLVTAGCVIAFNVRIGDHVKMGPNTVVRESVRIDPHVVIGQGAVVVADLSAPGTYVGVPAKPMIR